MSDGQNSSTPKFVPPEAYMGGRAGMTQQAALANAQAGLSAVQQAAIQQQAQNAQRYLAECCADHVDGRTFKVLQGKLRHVESQLADARGVIATQEKKLVAVADEEAWLKRELRRLDPRLYRARYERGGGR